MQKATRPSPQREAVIFALGSATRQAGMSGADVSSAVTTLRDSLRGDGSVAARVQGLRALGNAGRPELVPDAVAAARDDSPQVRAAAAEALRRVPTEPAQRALWTLSKDSDGEVQSAAFKALTEHPITAAAWQDLGATLKAGEVNPQAGPALVSMLREHLASSEAVPALLMTVANDERFDSSLRGRAYDLVAPAKGHDK
jgi:HEAT repeat protein